MITGTITTIRHVFLFFIIGIFTLKSEAANTYEQTSIGLEGQRDSLEALIQKNQISAAVKASKVYLRAAAQRLDNSHYLDAITLLFYCYKKQNKYDEILIFLNTEYQRTKAANERWAQLNIRYHLGQLYTEVAEYEKANQHFIDLLEELNQSKSSFSGEKETVMLRYKILTQIGILIAKADSHKAITYFENARKEALTINDTIMLANSYLNIGWVHLEFQEMGAAKVYLDTAMNYYKHAHSLVGQSNVHLEFGYLYEKEKKADKALQAYQKSYALLNRASKTKPLRIITDYQYLSDYFLKYSTLTALARIYKSKGALRQALHYAQTCYQLVILHEDYHHIAACAELLAHIYEAQNNKLQALEYLKVSNTNREKMIKANFKVNILKKEQHFELSQKERIITDLEVQSHFKSNVLRVTGGLLLVVILSICLLTRKIKRSKQHGERKAKEYERKLQVKAQSVVNLSLLNQSKSKLLCQLEKKLQIIYRNSKVKSPDLEKIIFQLRNSNREEEDWERFNNSFTSINPTFYNKLRAVTPNLTNLDLRHCALIRLNISAREGARIMGVSPKSVQMARYRIKKKLGLDTEVNLNSWMGQL